MLDAEVVIVDVVGRRHFQNTGSKFDVDVVVGDDGYPTIHQRHFGFLSDEMFVPLVFRMHTQGGIAHDGFRTGGGDGQKALSVFEFVFYIVQFRPYFFVDHFFIRQSRLALWIPVYHADAAVNEAFVVQVYENIDDGFR